MIFFSKLLKNIRNKYKCFKINKMMQTDLLHGYVSVVIDAECDTLNQYISPVLDVMSKSSSPKFSFYFAEYRPGFASSFTQYDNKKCFSNLLYPYLKFVKLFISPHIYPKGPENSIRIFFDHTICTSKFLHHPRELYYNYNFYFTTGKLNTEKVISIIKKNFPENKIKVIEIGYPKSDDLFLDKLGTRENILAKLGLDISKKTVIYAPSWEEGLSLREFGIDLIEIIAKNTQINFIIKPHPVSFTNPNDTNFRLYTGGIDWQNILSKFVKLPNCVLINKYTIEELLIASDIMITDLSSVALEFLLLNKPIIYLDCPDFEKIFNTLYKDFNDVSYKDLLSDPFSNAGRHVGVVCYNYKKINDSIQLLIEKPDYKINERKEYSNKLLSNKGNAKEVAAEEVISIAIEAMKKHN